MQWASQAVPTALTPMISVLAAQKLEEAKREARRRGDKKTQTSDAKFDEKFQVGHGISGEANKPWYAKSSAMLQPDEAPGMQVKHTRPSSDWAVSLQSASVHNGRPCG